MKVLVLGAGAIGSYYGTRLQQAGASVTYLVRPARARQLRQEGLRVHSELGSFSGPVALVEAGQELPASDLVVLACKSYDLVDAARSIAPAVGRGTAILPFLNGLQPYDQLDAMFGKDRVLGGVAYIAVMLQADGSTRQLGTADRVVLGARSPAFRDLAEDLYALLARSPGQRTVDERIEQQLWNKWAMLCTGAAVTCLFRGSVAQILATAHGAACVEAALEEACRVAQAEGFALQVQDLQQIRASLLNPASPWKASMARDIDQGLPRIEADAIVGDMLARAARHGIAVPTLRAAYVHLQVYAGAQAASAPPAG
ncbi:ketopantoate reductase family protein [Pseudorhodoferax sp.]|uniref:ketopantoate reductase family protein n=1 Tax=Pseudorhodoferax sp. TaxID=1993553 RepID=UPI002DD629F4|nr:ketopantoate reductase family protein [Pseudorhodoferax sp.]